MAGFLFIASVVLGLLSLATLGFAAVRAVRTKLRAASNPTTEPPRVVWSSPIVLVPLGLMGLCAAVLMAFFAFWVGCTAGPDLC